MDDLTNKNNKSAVFDETYKNYLSQLKGVDLSERAERLGLNFSGNELLVPFFGSVYRVSSAGIISPEGQQARFVESIVIFKYILMCPENLPGDSGWAAYHSFKDAQPLLHYFARETTKPIEEFFSGKIFVLEQASHKLGGSFVTDTAAFDLSIEFQILPKIPLFMRFNDKDEDFSAQCTILFKSSVGKHLDMESLGILGSLFAGKLISCAR